MIEITNTTELKEFIALSIREAIAEVQNQKNTKDLLTSKEVLSKFNISLSTLNRLEKAGIVKPHRLSSRKKVYKYAEICNVIK